MEREKIVEAMALVVATVKAGGAEPSELDVYASDGEIALTALEALGLAVVPVEPTEAMLEAGSAALCGWIRENEMAVAEDIYRAMLAAAPTWGQMTNPASGKATRPLPENGDHHTP